MAITDGSVMLVAKGSDAGPQDATDHLIRSTFADVA